MGRTGRSDGTDRADGPARGPRARTDDGRRIVADGGHPPVVERLDRWIEGLDEDSGGVGGFVSGVVEAIGGGDDGEEVDPEALAADLTAFVEENPLQRDTLFERAPELVAALDGADADTRAGVYAVLVGISGEGAVPEVPFDRLADGLDADSPAVRADAYELLVDYLWLDADVARSYLDALVEGVSDPDAAVRGQAVRGLMRAYGYDETMMVEADMTDEVEGHLPAVIDALDGIDPELAAGPASRLADRIAADRPDLADRLADRLLEAMDSEGGLVRLNALVAVARFARADPALVEGRLGDVADTAAVETALEQFDGQDDDTRRALSALLRRAAEADPGAFADLTLALAEAADDEDPEVRANLGAALRAVADARPGAVGFEAAVTQWVGTLAGDAGGPGATGGESAGGTGGGDGEGEDDGDGDGGGDGPVGSVRSPTEFADEAPGNVEAIRGYTTRMAGAMADADPEDRAAIAGMLDAVSAEHPAEINPDFETVAAHLDDGSAAVRRPVARTLARSVANGSFLDAATVEAHLEEFAARLDDPEQAVRDAALEALYHAAADSPGAVADHLPRIVEALDGLSDRSVVLAVSQWGETLAGEYPETTVECVPTLVDGLEAAADEDEDVDRFRAFYALATVAGHNPEAVREHVPAVADSGVLDDVTGWFGFPDVDPAVGTRLLALVAEERPEALTGVLDGLADYRDAEDEAVRDHVSTVFERVREVDPGAVEEAVGDDGG